ncbi:hypothetical protein OG871_40550 (plasmid) [Kitasatospora sp. NBC_00374]|uniref:GP88 family protein n=1 Tax=Kitasatospora sp. NBC_00374 TaxID=2975964 RepID=UPI002F91BC44
MDTTLPIPGLELDQPSRADWPAKLLSQNNTDVCRRPDGSEKPRVFTWTVPAWWVRLSTGKYFNTCPEAGVCGRSCYAFGRGSSYKRFPSARTRHLLNLELVLTEPEEWERRMKAELRGRSFRGGNVWVRIHDAGDFWSDEYVLSWLAIAKSAPHVRFYCYTKAIDRFRRLVLPKCPPNFLWCFSLGGTEDDLIDRQNDRHADVFPTVEALEAAGYSDQSDSDLLAVLGSPKVGIPANRYPAMKGTASFGELQRQAEEKKRARAAERAGRLALTAA